MNPQPWTVHIPHIAPVLIHDARDELEAIDRACALLGLAFAPEFSTADPGTESAEARPV